MNRDFQIMSRSFAIPVTMKEWDVLNHCERDWDKDDVGQMLAEIPGVRDVDYNGHFGLFIYLTIDKEYDNDGTLNAIGEIINRELSKPIYEIWTSEASNSSTLTTSDKVQKLKDDGLIEADAILLLDFVASTYEEAESVYATTLENWNER